MHIVQIRILNLLLKKYVKDLFVRNPCFRNKSRGGGWLGNPTLLGSVSAGWSSWIDLWTCNRFFIAGYNNDGKIADAPHIVHRNLLTSGLYNSVYYWCVSSLFSYKYDSSQNKICLHNDASWGTFRLYWLS